MIGYKITTKEDSYCGEGIICMFSNCVIGQRFNGCDVNSFFLRTK